ncbi:hypothetical protein [Hymenobacter latericus]|uniref:hypothetical protein n=1 Tax=Hymenobacter sp. YIM 151858-1 TaxID=2987688 RepID=UPI002227F6EA|nr:hypothetical protein [Hymenobacter sp. YIM 151858-1]UYZ61203.1 hypothetical protein OIS50_19735 [Hymenobacter sp. YIM 151858-1]
MNKVKNYQVWEVCCPIDEMNPVSWLSWVKGISNLMYNYCKNRSLYIFTTGPNYLYSIGYELGTVEQEGIFNGAKYLITSLATITFEQMKTIIESDEFYLGSIILVAEPLTDDKIQQIIIHQETELAKSGVECFRMSSDGMCFNWYNSTLTDKSIDVLKELVNL